MKRRNAILDKLDYQLPKEARIMDFGCGTGRTVYSLLDQGYPNVFGYDVYARWELRSPEDRSRFFIADSGGAGFRSKTTVSTSSSPNRCWNTCWIKSACCESCIASCAQGMLPFMYFQPDIV